MTNILNRFRIKGVIIAALAALTFLSGALVQAAAISVQEGVPGKMPAAQSPFNESSVMRAEIKNFRAARAKAIADQNRTAFRQSIQMAPLETLAVQNQEEVKTLDTWARETLQTITFYGSVNGRDPLYTALDMAFRPEAWENRNFIYIMAVPIRQQLGKLVSPAQAKRILEQGTVSPKFLAQPEVRRLLEHIARDGVLNSSVAQIGDALTAFRNMAAQLRIVAPPPGSKNKLWVNPVDLIPNTGVPPPPGMPLGKPVPGYSKTISKRVVLGFVELFGGWRDNDATLANSGIKILSQVLPTINPAAYPSMAKRVTEIWYNRLFDGTLVGVFFYFVSLTLFLIAAVGAAPGVRKVALGFFTVAVITHATFTGVRWWLAGRIPIQNEFESVLGAALVGCTIGLVLEYWKKNSLFGLAMSFVGFMAMTACFVMPYVVGTSMGANISRVDGMLSTYWLWIHVNVVISSYALIGASFCLGLLFLGIKAYYKLNPVSTYGLDPTASLIGGGHSDDIRPMTGSSAGGAAVMQAPAAAAPAVVVDEQMRRTQFLQQLDSANIVVLQMAFWFLGSGIIFGAVWADYAWGRPWGWDPKETFALVTWLVYLIIVHLRFVTPKYRPTWTAVLSVAGFAVMMFNWIGVNFFLVGLHSYA
jgi:cytochrome c-type biogenesis protein CcsB